MIVSAFFLRRLLGHLDGPRIANSYIRMGYAALGSAVAGVGALWLLGSYSPVGFAWSSRPAALVTIVVVGPIMLAAYLLLLKLFRVTELRDLLRPLLGRLGRGAAAASAAAPRRRRCSFRRRCRVRYGTSDAGTRHGLRGHRPDSQDFRRIRCGFLPCRARPTRSRNGGAATRRGPADEVRLLLAGGGRAQHGPGERAARRDPAARPPDLPGNGRPEPLFQARGGRRKSDSPGDSAALSPAAVAHIG